MVLLKQSKIYKISRPLIIVFMISGLSFLFICLLGLRDSIENGLLETVKMIGITILLPFPFIWYSIYLWRKRKEGRGFYWDDEGVVIDLKGAKVYWEEIEDIKFNKIWMESLSKSTMIYPHYTHHEKIRIRRKKWMPTPGHSIDWILIEKPKEYHESLLRAWEEKSKTLS